MTALVDLQESIAALELALEDEGWVSLTTTGENSFSLAGLKRIAVIARTMAVANPLIRRGLSLRAAYVFGQGVQIQADDPDVNDVVQHWWDTNDPTFTSDAARERLERSLGTDGNLFLACFTNPSTGAVRVRTVPFEEIEDKITNPEDRAETWFYRREYAVRKLQPGGAGDTLNFTTERKVVYYPDIAYRPTSRPRTIEGHEIRWDAPIYHLKVNDLEGWDYGIGDSYSALTWARAYRDFLADWATLIKALSQFAWKATGRNTTRTGNALNRVPNTTLPAGNTTGAGATVVLPPDTTLEAIPKSGATIDSESGRPLAAMVAAGLDLPVTILLADPGVTGARATAETLDGPLRAAMESRQELWRSVYDTLSQYVVLQSVKAPAGPLKGRVTRDPWDNGRESVTLAGADASPTVQFQFPELDTLPIDLVVKAIVDADGTGKLPPLVTLKLLLKALGVEDIDEVLEEVTDEDGNWVDPAQNAGTVAADAFRRGEDPMSALGLVVPPPMGTPPGTEGDDGTDEEDQ